MSCVARYLAASIGRCQHPDPTDAEPAKLCGNAAHHARVHDGAMLTVCQTHAAQIERRREPGRRPFAPLDPTKEEREEEGRLAQVKLDAERAARPPRKPRTLDQTMADEEADMGRKMRRASRKGVL
jgi:hypothetical protein